MTRVFMNNRKGRKQAHKCAKELRKIVKWLGSIHAVKQGVTRPFDHEPRCNCGHLFELCPQADCTNIAPLDLDAITRTIEADRITAEVNAALEHISEEQ